MRSRHWPEPPANQATAHSLQTQAWAATWPLARQRQSAVGLHLRNTSLMDGLLHDELHWLDVPERIEYKLCVMVYRCLHGQTPCYLADHLIPASDAAPRRGRLRSANRNCLTVPRCRLSCRAFDYAGPTVWNSLPDELRNSDSFDSLKRFMKTILFSRY